MDTVGDDWEVVEVRAPSWEALSTSAPLKEPATEVIPAFFEWVQAASALDFVIRRRAKRWYERGPSHELEILGEDVVAQIPIAGLARSATNGWDLLVACRCEWETLRDFFTRNGFSPTTPGDTIESRLFDPLRPELALAAKLGAASSLVFAHDGDPVYLLKRKR